jgi:hypothetical protein
MFHTPTGEPASKAMLAVGQAIKAAMSMHLPLGTQCPDSPNPARHALGNNKGTPNSIIRSPVLTYRGEGGVGAVLPRRWGRGEGGEGNGPQHPLTSAAGIDDGKGPLLMPPGDQMGLSIKGNNNSPSDEQCKGGGHPNGPPQPSILAAGIDDQKGLLLMPLSGQMGLAIEGNNDAPSGEQCGGGCHPDDRRKGGVGARTTSAEGGDDVPSNYPELPVCSPALSMFAVGPAIKAMLAVGPSPANQDLSWKMRGIKRKRCKFSCNRDP